MCWLTGCPDVCRGCLHPESTLLHPGAPGHHQAERTGCPAGQCVLMGSSGAAVIHRLPYGALLGSDDSTLGAEAAACTDSPTSYSAIHSNSQTNPYLQRFPSFLSSQCPYYPHTFCSQCPGPKYPTIPLLMWLDPNN